MVALKPLLLPQQLEPRFVTTKRRLEDYRTPPASPRTTETNMMYKEYDGTISLVSPPVTPTGAEYQSPRAFHPFTPPGHYNSDESCHSSRSHFFTKGTELSDLVEEPAELDVDDEQLRLNTTGNSKFSTAMWMVQ